MYSSLQPPCEDPGSLCCRGCAPSRGQYLPWRHPGAKQSVWVFAARLMVRTGSSLRGTFHAVQPRAHAA
jgi:hypothetical protein